MAILTTTTTTTTEAQPVMETYLDEPPAYHVKDISDEDRKALIISDARSISSSSSDVTTTTLASDHSFAPTKTLLVGSRGIRLIRLPMPSSQLDIPITDTSGNVEYLSSRAKKCSGNAVLFDGSGKELLASEYQFGPGRSPKIRLLDGISGNAADPKAATALITTKGKWTSRKQSFVLPGGQTFTWRYKREYDVFKSNARGKEAKATHLVLEVPLASAGHDDKGRKAPYRRVAELVRNVEARTPGTSSTDAGNGGELKIDNAYAESVGIREEVIVASLLMMLKKEIDRRRALQWAVLISVAGS